MAGPTRLRRPPPPAIDPVDSAVRPFWSVMIPCFDNADLMASTLRSVLEQDPGPAVMQIEVVDDASSDDAAREVAASVGGTRVSYFRQPYNVGAASNFTTCVQRSRGHWVHILHSDDLVGPGFYSAYEARIANCPDALLVGGKTIVFDGDDHPLDTTPPLSSESGYMVDAAFTFARDHPLRCVSAVVARSAYERFGGFRPELVHANDWEMWTRLAASGPVAWVDEAYGLYRIHPASDTTRLHRSTRYIDDCRRASDLIASHFRPGQQAEVRKVARHHVARYALSVASEMLQSGEWRLAANNALRAVAIDRSTAVRSVAWTTLRHATAMRLRPRGSLTPASPESTTTATAPNRATPNAAP